MAQSLEKAFLQKVAQMPQDELELPPPPPRIKTSKPGRKGRGNASEQWQQAGYRSVISVCIWAQIFLLNVMLSCICCSPILPLPTFSFTVSGGVTTAHQVPAVSQSVYSPPTPETPDSILSTPPQTHLTKSLPPSFSNEQSIPSITALPPTQPTAKVTFETLFLCCQSLTN